MTAVRPERPIVVAGALAWWHAVVSVLDALARLRGWW